MRLSIADHRVFPYKTAAVRLRNAAVKPFICCMPKKPFGLLLVLDRGLSRA